MKLQNLLLAGLVIAGLSACSDNTTDGIDNGKTKEYNTFLTVKFSSPYDNTNPFTRTLGVEDAETTDGTSIEKAHVYLVDKSNKITHANSSDVVADSTEPISVAEGNYRVFVVANPSNLTPLKSVGEDIQNLILGVTEANAQKGFDNGKFLMTSAVNGDNIANAGMPVMITALNNQNNPAIVDAKVDRMAVKIIDVPVEDGPKLSGEILEVKDADGNLIKDNNSYKITFEGFALVNGNESFNLFQTWKNSTTNPIGMYMETPQGKLENNQMTGYYNPFSKYTEVTVEEGEVTSIKNLSNKDTFLKVPVFTVENRPEFILNKKLTAGKAQTTGVIYRAVMGDGTKDLYYVGGIVYDVLTKVEELEIFKGTQLIDKDPAVLRTMGIKVYEKGQMYYTYFIEDQNYSVNYNDNEKTRYYAVHRNSVYKLEVEELTRLGDDVPGGGDITPINPNPEIDPDNVYLKVNVKINPWILNVNKIKL